MYDFPPQTNGFNSLERNFAILEDADPCVFMISLILSGTLCAFSVGLAEGTEDVLVSSFFSSSVVIKLLSCRSFNSFFSFEEFSLHYCLNFDFSNYACSSTLAAAN